MTHINILKLMKRLREQGKQENLLKGKPSDYSQIYPRVCFQCYRRPRQLHDSTVVARVLASVV